MTRKGAQNVPVITGVEKGETISLIGCCNAEGNFLPPTLISKGVKRKPEFSVGLPPGSNVYMNPKSAYINEELFLKWFNEEFIPRKAPQEEISLFFVTYVELSHALLSTIFRARVCEGKTS